MLFIAHHWLPQNELPLHYKSLSIYGSMTVELGNQSQIQENRTTASLHAQELQF